MRYFPKETALSLLGRVVGSSFSLINSRLFSRQQQQRKAQAEMVEHERQQQWEREEALKALPLEEARRRAELLLTDPRKFQCELASGPLTQEEQLALQPLAPLLHEFFGKYDRVLLEEGSNHELTPELEPLDEGANENNSFLVIGHLDFDSDYVVRPGEETIYFTWEGSAPEPAYPTIFHTIVCIDAEREVNREHMTR